MNHLLITGGTGFFGKSILDYRRRNPDFLRDVQISILSRHPSSFIAENRDIAIQDGISYLEGDIRSFCLSPNEKIDAIIHAAAALDPALEADNILSTSIKGTNHVVEVARSIGCSKVLYTSSGAIYGRLTNIVDETCPCIPQTPYGDAKRQSEIALLESGLDIKIARCFAFTGKFLNRQIYYAIGNFIRDCLDNRPIVIKGDGTPLRSYLYADDLVEWLFAILERGKPGRPYNVGSPQGVSIRQLAETVRAALGTKNEIQILGTPTSEPPSVYVPNVDRALSELGLQVKVGLEDAIRRSAKLDPYNLAR